MARAPFTNIHIHVFNTECAPDNFLRIITSNFVRKHPKTFKSIIDKRFTRGLIRQLAKWGANKKGKDRGSVDKYISFLEVGTTNRQLDIYRDALLVAQKYDPQCRLIGLSLDMDYMDDKGRPPKNFNTQLKELKQIKKYYPDHFFPFVCVDPRGHAGQLMVNWMKKFFENGMRSPETGMVRPYFAGIKMYPALGFFPFDPRLDEMYAYAEREGIPIMTHCTRVGSQYIGPSIESLIPHEVDMIQPENSASPEFIKAKSEIHARIERYYSQNPSWIKNNDYGDNDLACDLFGHPQNYIPVMLKYPKLKICLAHMGGDDQIELMSPEKASKNEIIKLDGYNWASLVKELMLTFPNLYTDISYTLAKLDEEKVRIEIRDWLQSADQEGKSLSERVLFGTDFYMTEREARESELYQKAQNQLTEWMTVMSRDNCERYLFELP